MQPAAAGDVVEQESQQRRRVTGLESSPLAADGKPYRLLIVEDQPTNQKLLLKLLSPFGFELRCADVLAAVGIAIQVAAAGDGLGVDGEACSNGLL